jgi:hypothetical protein
VLGYIARVTGWLRSIGKLNHPGDFQAIAAGARSLFEITVDLTLLLHDSSCPFQKLFDWELSARLEHARRVVRALDAKDDQVFRERVAIHRCFIQQVEPLVVERRGSWAWKKHPPRWTGRSLRDDAMRCDSLVESTFVSHYELRFAELCWSTHGSAFAGIRGIPEEMFPTEVALNLGDVLYLSRESARLTLKLVDRYDAICEARFSRLDDECTLQIGARLGLLDTQI